MKRNVTAILLSAVMALGLAGCGSTAVKGTGSSAASGSVVTTASGTGTTVSGEEAASSGAVSDGGDLNVMIETPVEGLDPQTTEDGTSFEVIADYMDGLMQMDHFMKYRRILGIRWGTQKRLLLTEEAVTFFGFLCLIGRMRRAKSSADVLKKTKNCGSFSVRRLSSLMA